MSWLTIIGVIGVIGVIGDIGDIGVVGVIDERTELLAEDFRSSHSAFRI